MQRTAQALDFIAREADSRAGMWVAYIAAMSEITERILILCVVFVFIFVGSAVLTRRGLRAHPDSAPQPTRDRPQ